MNEITIRFNALGYVNVETIADGITSTKAIEFKDLAESFMECMPRQVSSGILPENVVAFSESNSGKYVVLSHKETAADIRYYDTAYTDFPLPKLVFGFKVSGKRVLSNNS